MEEKKSLGEYRYTHLREAFGFGRKAVKRSKERSYEDREGKSESEWGRERGAHLHAEPQSDCGAQLTRFVPSFLQPAALGFSMESENGFLPFPRRTDGDARATNFSSTFTPSFRGLQMLAFPTTLSFSLPHCFLFPVGVSSPFFQTTRCFHLQHRLPSLCYAL